MKTQEIIFYEVYGLGGDEPEFVTESFDEAQDYFDKGYAIHEVHTSRWQPTKKTKTSTTVILEW